MRHARHSLFLNMVAQNAHTLCLCLIAGNEMCWPMFQMFNITRKICAHLIMGTQHCLLADERERKSIALAVMASKITCFEELSFSSCMEQSERICVTVQDTATPTKSHLFKTPADGTCSSSHPLVALFYPPYCM